jgi:hypothetical protein
LQAEERLIFAKMLRKRHVAENVSIVAGNAKKGETRAAGLNGHQQRLNCFAGAKKGKDFRFPALQLLLQLRR